MLLLFLFRVLLIPSRSSFWKLYWKKTRYNIKPEFDNFQGNSRRRHRQQESKKDPLTNLFEDVDIATQYNKYSSGTRQSLEAWSGAQIDLGLVESTIEHICRHEGDGAILVFLMGWDEISKLLEKVEANNFLGYKRRFLLIPLHGSVPTMNQRQISKLLEKFEFVIPLHGSIVIYIGVYTSSILLF